jgi:DsbC/DsbD-like thiol-disulfide interchange protein
MAVFLPAMAMIIALLVAWSSNFAPSHPVGWSFAAIPEQGGAVRIEMTATMEPGWYLYATELPGDEGPVPTIFRFKPSEQFVLVDAIQEPVPVEKYDPNFAMQVRYHSGTAVFVQDIERKDTSAIVVEGELEFMCCNDHTCLPPRIVPFSIPIPGGSPKHDR